MSVSSAITASSATVHTAEKVLCRHCDTVCPDETVRIDDHFFCCHGCKTVYELLHENGLERFYTLNEKPGVRVGTGAGSGAYVYLDEATTRRTIVQFTDGKFTRVTFRVPAIHCLACVWLLENLFRLRAGVGPSTVNFPRKEVTLSFEDARIRLSEVVELMASLGYAPDLKLDALGRENKVHPNRSLHLKIGVAGFAFGNTMLLCFPSYLGLPTNETQLQPWFGWFSLALGLPVFLYSASDYWRASWLCVRRRMLTIEFPIAIGIFALFAQSVFEVVRGQGPGFLDSFTGLVFLLLCGKLFQRKTYDVLSFDRDYRSYFPLSILRRGPDGDTPVPVTQLKVGDRILVRNQELIPADATLVRGEATIDYSFVTGEAAPQPRAPGDYLYAGGRQVGAAIELEIAKEISQSYLTSLWNNAAFRKEDAASLENVTNTAGRYFTWFVLVLSLGAATYWYVADPTKALRVITSVLIVACPCALALAAPFSLGSALRWLGRHKVYLKNTGVLETLAKIDTVVFDKTGTLTLPAHGGIEFEGATLDERESGWIGSLARLSTHPHSQGIAAKLKDHPAAELAEFREETGAGVGGRVAGRQLLLGSVRWLAANGLAVTAPADGATSVHLAIDGAYRGRFVFRNVYRPGLAGVLQKLQDRFALALLSGDNDRERATLSGFFGAKADLHFGQLPDAKLEFIRARQQAGRKVLMIGDGLNDAGALKQSDVGVAVTEDAAQFSPACDAIWAADRFPLVPQVLHFARLSVRVVLACFGISLLYNAVGLTLACRGDLSPLASAILMPASSLSVILSALIGTRWAARRAGLGRTSSWA